MITPQQLDEEITLMLAACCEHYAQQDMMALSSAFPHGIPAPLLKQAFGAYTLLVRWAYSRGRVEDAQSYQNTLNAILGREVSVEETIRNCEASLERTVEETRRGMGGCEHECPRCHCLWQHALPSPPCSETDLRCRRCAGEVSQ